MKMHFAFTSRMPASFYSLLVELISSQLVHEHGPRITKAYSILNLAASYCGQPYLWVALITTTSTTYESWMEKILSGSISRAKSAKSAYLLITCLFMNLPVERNMGRPLVRWPKLKLVTLNFIAYRCGPVFQQIRYEL